MLHEQLWTCLKQMKKKVVSLSKEIENKVKQSGNFTNEMYNNWNKKKKNLVAGLNRRIQRPVERFGATEDRTRVITQNEQQRVEWQ